MWRLVWLALLGAAAVCAQPRTFPIVSLTVTGNRIYKTEKILAVTGLKVGQPVVEKEFDAARDRLLACGYFESVGYQYKPSADGTGYNATFEVKEVEQSYPVKFDRLAKPEKELLAVLEKSDPLFGEKIPGTAPLLAKYAKVLEAAVGEKVVGKVMADGPGELRVVFQPAKLPPSIAEVRFLKNTVLPQNVLQRAISGSAVGAVWEEKRFRQILDASIRPLYEARGRLRIAFPKITVEPVQDVEGLRVSVEVEEGETYTLGEVTVDAQDADERSLLRAGNLKKGDLANFDDIKQGVERMRALVRRSGYLQAKADVERALDDEKKVVNLTVRIEHGPQYTFRKLNIVGLDILTEPAIRKMWGMKEGQPFNPDYPESFLNRIREEMVLDNLGKTKSEVKMDEKALTAEVTLYFSGQPPPPKKKFP
jgi:outer membrane protein insertion porin family